MIIKITKAYTSAGAYPPYELVKNNFTGHTKYEIYFKVEGEVKDKKIRIFTDADSLDIYRQDYTVLPTTKIQDNYYEANAENGIFRLIAKGFLEHTPELGRPIYVVLDNIFDNVAYDKININGYCKGNFMETLTSKYVYSDTLNHWRPTNELVCGSQINDYEVLSFDIEKGLATRLTYTYDKDTHIAKIVDPYGSDFLKVITIRIKIRVNEDLGAFVYIDSTYAPKNPSYTKWTTSDKVFYTKGEHTYEWELRDECPLSFNFLIRINGEINRQSKYRKEVLANDINKLDSEFHRYVVEESNTCDCGYRTEEWRISEPIETKKGEDLYPDNLEVKNNVYALWYKWLVCGEYEEKTDEKEYRLMVDCVDCPTEWRISEPLESVCGSIAYPDNASLANAKYNIYYKWIKCKQGESVVDVKTNEIKYDLVDPISEDCGYVKGNSIIIKVKPNSVNAPERPSIKINDTERYLTELGNDLWGIYTSDLQSVEFGWMPYHSLIGIYDFINTDTVTRIKFNNTNAGDLEYIDTSNIITNNITNMWGMFYGCYRLKEADLSKFNTAKVVYMKQMFWGCKSFKELNLSSFNTSKVTDMEEMFYNCNSLTSLDLSNFDVSNVTTIKNMFYDCSSLATLNLDGWALKDSCSTWEMLHHCKALKTIYMRGCTDITIKRIKQALEHSKLTSVNIITQ